MPAQPSVRTLKAERNGLNKLVAVLEKALAIVEKRLDKIPQTLADCQKILTRVVAPAMAYWRTITTGTRVSNGQAGRITNIVNLFISCQVFHQRWLKTMALNSITLCCNMIFVSAPQLFAKHAITLDEFINELLFAQKVFNEPGEYNGDMTILLADCGGFKAVQEIVARNHKEQKGALQVEAYLSIMMWQRLRNDKTIGKFMQKAAILAIQTGVIPTSSAEAERLFSILKMFNHLRLSSLNDQIEAGVLLRYNGAQMRMVKAQLTHWHAAEEVRCQRKEADRLVAVALVAAGPAPGPGDDPNNPLAAPVPTVFVVPPAGGLAPTPVMVPPELLNLELPPPEVFNDWSVILKAAQDIGNAQATVVDE
jgi:hypothetical protein